MRVIDRSGRHIDTVRPGKARRWVRVGRAEAAYLLAQRREMERRTRRKTERER